MKVVNIDMQVVDISGWYLLGKTCLALTSPRKRTMPIRALQNHSIKGFYRHGERACANKSTVYCLFSWELTIARIAAGPRGAQCGSVPEKSNSYSEHPSGCFSFCSKISSGRLLRPPEELVAIRAQGRKCSKGNGFRPTINDYRC